MYNPTTLVQALTEVNLTLIEESKSVYAPPLMFAFKETSIWIEITMAVALFRI
jgi:hypothetical protein